jgi:type IV pilus biogenesis protein CpaD/CtpE
MSAPFLRLALLLVTAATLQACAQIPPDYSPDYVHVPVMSRNHPDRVSHYELAPKSCLVPDPTDTGLGGSRLPPGCANNANLLAMVERKKDVVKGRKLGAAPASPSARAAQKYIYGSEGTSSVGINLSNQPSSAPGTPAPGTPAPGTPAPGTPSVAAK